MNAEHVHRWRFEEPNGPVSRGRCACGAEQVAHNVYRHDRGGEHSAFDEGGKRWDKSLLTNGTDNKRHGAAMRVKP